MDVNRGAQADQYGDGRRALPNIIKVRKSSRPTADTSGVETGTDEPSRRRKRGVSKIAIEVMLGNVMKKKQQPVWVPNGSHLQSKKHHANYKSINHLNLLN
jgi:hypothetical protein